MVRANAEQPLMGEQLSAFREAFQSYRDYNSSYFLNKNGKFRPQPPGVQTLGSSGDYHYRTESEALLGIERAYHFDRNDPIVGQAITRVVDQIFPEDMTLDPQTGDTGLNQALRDYWYDWAYDRHQCDLEEQADFMELERLAFRNMFVGGDVQFCRRRKARCKCTKPTVAGRRSIPPATSSAASNSMPIPAAWRTGSRRQTFPAWSASKK
jgi:hypothetical protein